MDLLKTLKQDFPNLNFATGKDNSWSPDQQTIFYTKPISKYTLLHELGHALEKHQDYQLDVQLLKHEAEAWARAQIIGRNYNLKIPQSYINQAMDTYRNWILARSKCPDCNLVGLQQASLNSTKVYYSCLNCNLKWHVPLETKCLVRRIRSSSE